MRRIGFRTVAAVAASGLALGACGDGSGGSDDDAGSGAVTVVASFYPLAEAARQVGGDRVAVTNLTAAGAEPHELELTTGQVDDLLDADVALVLGREFQPAVEEVAERRDGATIVVLDALGIDATGSAAHDHGDGDEHEGGDGDELDPHVWLDPTLMAEIVGAVEDALAAAAPGDAATFTANARAYLDSLGALDEELAAGLATCARDEIVTAHAAFGWLAAHYGLEQHAIAGLSPDEEPSADRLAELADLATDEGVTTVFTETLVSPDLAETLAREAGGLRTAVLNPLEGLTEEQADAGADYLSVMRENLAALQEGLGCS